MKSTLTSSQKTKEIKRLAYECAERKYNGCNENCNKCPLNISIYLDDPREAVMIQTNAELDYQNSVQLYNEQLQKQIEQQKEENAGNIAKIVGYLLGIFLLIGVPIIMIQSCINSCSSSTSMNESYSYQSKLTFDQLQSNILIAVEER
jgi:hypothetical protein